MNPGKELDALIAEEVMGYEVVECDDDIITIQSMSGWVRVPDYSTDLAAAWQVVEKLDQMMPKTWSFSLHGSGTEWCVGIDSNDGQFLQNAAGVQIYQQAETAPLAICLAAIKACEAAKD